MTLLGIQAGLSSAVASAFIGEVQSNLQPDYTQLSYGLLVIVVNASIGKIAGAAFAGWSDPDLTVVCVQAILYLNLLLLSSPCSSLCWTSNGSIVTLRLICVDPLLIAADINNTR